MNSAANPLRNGVAAARRTQGASYRPPQGRGAYRAMYEPGR